MNEKNERVSVLLKESFIGSFIDGEHHIGTNAAKGMSASSTFGGGVDANERHALAGEGVLVQRERFGRQP